ncbi:hypothetical protein LNQ03_01875 [Klebsiella pneumoniae subsp. pneumoniae]|nr:hypothetical protein [Klebsiella pneumoniae subsp. pneumoniae]
MNKAKTDEATSTIAIFEKFESLSSRDKCIAVALFIGKLNATSLRTLMSSGSLKKDAINGAPKKPKRKQLHQMKHSG